jgi:hypothetical protein
MLVRDIVSDLRGRERYIDLVVHMMKYLHWGIDETREECPIFIGIL